MKDNILARRYATALIETIENDAQLESVKEDFDKIGSIIENVPEFFSILEHPMISANEKKIIINELCEKFNISGLFKNFLFLLVEKERIKYIKVIKTQFIFLYKEKINETEIEITSAFDLNENEVKKIEDIFAKITGKKIVSKYGKDKTLIGGLKVKIENTVYDGSIRNKLNLIKEMF